MVEEIAGEPLSIQHLLFQLDLLAGDQLSVVVAIDGAHSIQCQLQRFGQFFQRLAIQRNSHKRAGLLVTAVGNVEVIVVQLIGPAELSVKAQLGRIWLYRSDEIFRDVVIELRWFLHFVFSPEDDLRVLVAESVGEQESSKVDEFRIGDFNGLAIVSLGAAEQVESAGWQKILRMETSWAFDGLRRLSVVLDVFGVELSQQPDGFGINFKDTGVDVLILLGNDGLVLVIDDDIRVKGLDGRLLLQCRILFDLGSRVRKEQFHGSLNLIRF